MPEYGLQLRILAFWGYFHNFGINLEVTTMTPVGEAKICWRYPSNLDVPGRKLGSVVIGSMAFYHQYPPSKIPVHYEGRRVPKSAFCTEVCFHDGLRFPFSTKPWLELAWPRRCTTCVASMLYNLRGLDVVEIAWPRCFHQIAWPRCCRNCVASMFSSNCVASMLWKLRGLDVIIKLRGLGVVEIAWPRCFHQIAWPRCCRNCVASMFSSNCVASML